MSKTTHTPAAPAPGSLARKTQDLARVTAETEAIEPLIAELRQRTAARREVLNQAKLAEIVARGTPGFEDDVQAAKSVAKAQKDLDEACLQLDAAEERSHFLDQAEEQLRAEVERLKGEEHFAHIAAAKAQLHAEILASEEAFGEIFRKIAAVRALDNAHMHLEDLFRIFEVSTPFKLKQLAHEGQDLGIQIRRGASVKSVFP